MPLILSKAEAKVFVQYSKARVPCASLLTTIDPNRLYSLVIVEDYRLVDDLKSIIPAMYKRI